MTSPFRWARVVIGSLLDTVLFQVDDYEGLLAQIIDSFGPSVSFNIKPKQLAKVEPLKALNRIQVQLSALYKEKGGYVLVDLSEPLDDELQCVLVYTSDPPRACSSWPWKSAFTQHRPMRR